MLNYDLSDKLQKKLEKLLRKNPQLVRMFYNKVQEIITHNEKTVNTYKNLRFPYHKYKRIHLTRNFILIFRVRKRTVQFTDILRREEAYK